MLHDLLLLDAAAEADRIGSGIRQQVVVTLGRRGVVVGLSGGVDSAVSAALAVRALGARRVIGLLMPEVESAHDSTRLGHVIGEHLGIETVVEDVTSLLHAAGCYRKRDAAIASVVPGYGDGCRSKIVRSPSSRDGRYRILSIVVEWPDGRQTRTRLTAGAHLSIIAATNFKQRVRKMIEYHYADLRRYAVAGTANLAEHDQGFFVKNGDGAADLKPIAHLYKTQVYQLAEFLRIPDEIRRRPPTTDTFSLAQTQEEFFFPAPYEAIDLCLYGLDHGLPAADVAAGTGLTLEQVQLVFGDIASKRRAAAYLHAPALALSGPSPNNSPTIT
jgi:NAD+ synthase